MVTDFFVLTLPGYRQIEQLACVEVLSEAQAVCGSLTIRDISLSSADELWKARAGLGSTPGSVILLCAGNEPPVQSLAQGLGAILRKAWGPDVTLCSIGAASRVLAGLGLLNGKQAAVLPEELEQLSAEHSLVRWHTASRLTQDGNLITCVGFFGATEATLAALRVAGKGAAAERVASRLLIRSAASPSDQDFRVSRAAMHPAVRRAAEVLNREPLQAWNTSAVAQIACVSERHLQRLFKAEFSCGILEYLQKLRLERAVQLVRAEPRVTLERVAQAAGFTSTQQLRRIWRKEHGIPPSAVRRQNFTAANELGRPVEAAVGI